MFFTSKEHKIQSMCAKIPKYSIYTGDTVSFFDRINRRQKSLTSLKKGLMYFKKGLIFFEKG